ncbi:hypothetical protein DICPUDRAFT_155163 [Dictyostelium purpureum]|uniref:Uncharacterized protein n=1 Tax=Dictyostelium purpureum TaxID=5786 RepID=F0ZT86_DICPU|nr:uncharacterized protein DICPUDRAFT_155163 [Dictyostelium purpureum]EGC32841.1 hypothetical protein DICPUDRAFT_155163 [Dictyostelium purpureum]|eukprot:XP_003290626.1 hypothetical protein DICPUDRAFT_155163 [Dictyostelium purpureum]
MATKQVFNSKTWGSALINQRISMKAEYKNNLKRLRYLAEERHIQYRDEYIKDVKLRIEKNKEAVEEQARKIRNAAQSSNKKSILEMGWDSVRKQMVEERNRKRANAKIIFDKKKTLESRVRREWLIEMNDKCTQWNKSPDEMKYAKYRLLNKKILERLPKSSNYILDRHEMQDEYGTNLEISDKDNYKGPLRTGTQKLAYILANNLPLPSEEAVKQTEDASLSVDPSSPEYQEYLEFVKYSKERQKRKEQKLRELSENSPAHKLNNENTLRNHTHGIDFADEYDYSDYSTDITSSIELSEENQSEGYEEGEEDFEEGEEDVEEGEFDDYSEDLDLDLDIDFRK